MPICLPLIVRLTKVFFFHALENQVYQMVMRYLYIFKLFFFLFFHKMQLNKNVYIYSVFIKYFVVIKQLLTNTKQHLKKCLLKTTKYIWYKFKLTWVYVVNFFFKYICPLHFTILISKLIRNPRFVQ